MDSARQAQTNRQNAARSTGLRSAAGKARSAGNATKHGFFTKDLAAILPAADPEDAESRRLKLQLFWGPETGAEVQLVERLAEIRAELTRASTFEEAYLADQARQAVLEDDSRRPDEALENGRLLLDEEEPLEGEPAGSGAILTRLEATAEGCRWLLNRWGYLIYLLDSGSAWNREECHNFCRMLGMTPRLDGRDPLFRRAILAFEVLCPEAGQAIQDEAGCVLPTAVPGMSFEAENAMAFLRAVIARETTRLEEQAAAPDAEQAIEATGAAARTLCDMGAGFERFQRYRAGLRREESKTIDRLLKLQKAQADLGARAARACLGRED